MGVYELRVRRASNHHRIQRLSWAWFGQPGPSDVCEALETVRQETEVPVDWEFVSPRGDVIDKGRISPGR